MKFVRYLRSFNPIPKWLIFAAVTGTWLYGGILLEIRHQWPWIIPATSVVPLATYWALFGLKRRDSK